MTLQDVGVRISDNLKLAPDLFGFHLYTKTEHVFVSKEDWIELMAAFGQWLDPKNEDHMALVWSLADAVGQVLSDGSGGALDE